MNKIYSLDSLFFLLSENYILDKLILGLVLFFFEPLHIALLVEQELVEGIRILQEHLLQFLILVAQESGQACQIPSELYLTIFIHGQQLLIGQQATHHLLPEFFAYGNLLSLGFVFCHQVVDCFLEVIVMFLEGLFCLFLGVSKFYQLLCILVVSFGLPFLLFLLTDTGLLFPTFSLINNLRVLNFLHFLDNNLHQHHRVPILDPNIGENNPIV